MIILYCMYRYFTIPCYRYSAIRSRFAATLLGQISSAGDDNLSAASIYFSLTWLRLRSR
jgi:hypothetical protein